MTIGLGMKLRDGIILAADRQMTAQGSHKYEEDKIFWIEGVHWNVFLTYCDSPSIAKEAKEKIEAALSPLDNNFSSEDYESPSLKAIKEEVEITLKEISNRYYENPAVELLVVIETQLEESQIFLYRDRAFHAVDGFCVIGCGDSPLFQYLKKAYSPKDSLEYGKKLAAYVLAKTGELVDKCGKGSDMLVINHRGRTESLTKIETHRIILDIEMREINSLRKLISG